MNNKTVKTSILAVIMILCTSCSGVIGQIRQGNGVDSEVRSRLGAGILLMEGSTLEVSSEQAQSLLPLWKAVKNLSDDSSIPEAEMTAVYRQIQDNMSAQQLQEIQAFTWTDADLNTMIQKYGVQSASKDQSQVNAAQNPGGGMPVGGMPAGDLGGGMDFGEMGAAPQGQNSASSTMVNSDGSNDLNFILAEAVISLLQQHMDA